LDPSGATTRQLPCSSSATTRTGTHNVQEHLIVGSLLAAGVVLLFLGNFRSTLIAALAIPTSVLGTFAAMAYLGYTLNNITLLALALAVGIVIDDAIVVLENISRHIERGLSPFRAAMRGSAEVGFTLLAMNLSLVAVFISILFMGGLVEKLFREFSITLAAAMLLSLAVSLTLTPSLCSRWLLKKDARPPGPLRRTTERAFDADLWAALATLPLQRETPRASPRRCTRVCLAWATLRAPS
jgi:multidrug efflux pump